MRKKEILKRQAQLLKEVDFLTIKITQNERNKKATKKNIATYRLNKM